LRDFARTNPHLVVKGGVLGDSILSEAEVRSLAEIAPRDELLAKMAGLMAAPLQQFAGLLQAVPRDFAFGLRALIDQGGAPGAPEPAAETQTDTDQTETDQTDSAEATSDAPTTDAVDDAPEQES
jgi:large subunit ribosomal protein L10